VGNNVDCDSMLSILRNTTFTSMRRLATVAVSNKFIVDVHVDNFGSGTFIFAATGDRDFNGQCSNWKKTGHQVRVIAGHRLLLAKVTQQGKDITGAKDRKLIQVHFENDGNFQPSIYGQDIVLDPKDEHYYAEWHQLLHGDPRATDETRIDIHIRVSREMRVTTH
jgi:hypothetical protein